MTSAMENKLSFYLRNDSQENIWEGRGRYVSLLCVSKKKKNLKQNIQIY